MATKKKAKPGRPSPYTKGYSTSFPNLARKLSMLGAKDTEIADVFGVSVSTLNLWKTKHPELSESLKAGKMIADAEVVDRLYQRALGYEHDEVDIRVVDHAIVQTPIRKFYPPDTTAAIFWLKNRQRETWRDKVETGVTTTDGKDVDLTPERMAEGARRLAFMLHRAAINTESAHG